MGGQLEETYGRKQDHGVVALISQDKLSEGFIFWKAFRIAFDFAQSSSR